MKRLLGSVIGGCFLVAAGAAVAAPPGHGQHFDCSDGGSGVSCASDDTGCVPQSKDDPSGGVAATLKCGDGLSKAFGAAIRSVIKCHKKMADLTLKADPARDDESCETFDAVKHKSAKEKLDAAIAKVAPICTSTQLSLAAAEESTLFASKSNALSLDAQAGEVYCDGTTNIDPAGAGGDDAGTIDTAAADAKDRLKCADTVGSELGKLAAAAIKCHIKLADSDFGGKDFDENVCEENDPAKGKAALQKYNAAMTKLTTKAICTQSCLSASNRTALGANVLAQVEAGNQLVYPCPSGGSTTTTTTSSTTTSIGGTCTPIVVGQAIPHTYRINGTTGEKRCTTNSSNECNGGSRNGLGCSTDDMNATTGCPGATCPGCCSVVTRFKTCTTDADCGGTAGACMNLPWVTADGQVMPFSTGTQVTFTVATAGSFPTCEHNLCIPCGNPNAACAGIPGCAVAGNPNGCVPRGTQGCCDQPAFVVPTFFVNILGGLCSRVDQIGCGGGIVNTSQPQTGHNKVTKNGDTSDPGADCCYNGHPGSECLGGVNMNDDPAAKPCTTAQGTGAGGDYAGKIVKTIGGGAADADGIHFRYTVPELSTTWTDGQSPPGTCANGSTYDDGELLVSQLILKADTTTSGATGSFTDQNGDGCKRAGAGFISATNTQTDGPITVPGAEGGGPARPQPYNGSSGSVTAAVSEVFSGPNSPIRDIGFVAITPNQAAVVVPALSCSCTVQPDCPE